ncbi:discoidin domain-containing protein [Lysinibacillus sp. NPDC093692]|uniref:discoidin domain-containing protein n=1 Tax=Lysinibacillus sp. NPDC093692 TaxID=3390578 RepID=UPI003D033749
MVITIDGNWSNGSLRTGVSNLGGVTTNGLRRLGDGIFYCEILSENTVSYKHIGVATPLNQSWISYGKFTNALYPIGSAVAGATYGILLDLTGTVGKFSWNKDGGEFSSWINLIDSQGNTIKDFRLGIVGSSSGGGTQYFTLNYNAKTFKTKHSDILGVAKGEVYTFDGSEKLRLEKSLFKSKNKTYSLKLTDTWHNLKMTSNDTPSPLVASASSIWSATFPAWKAFNGTNNDSNDCWVTVGGSIAGWVQLDFGSPKYCNQIKLTSRSGSTANACPKDFTITASNDGIVFDKIANITGQTKWALNETRMFTFKNAKKYRIYRLLIISNDGYSSYSAIGQLQFGYKGNTMIGLPKSSQDNFIKYGQIELLKLNEPIPIKNYLLQRKVSENSEETRATKLDRKPLSIGFN